MPVFLPVPETKIKLFVEENQWIFMEDCLLKQIGRLKIKYLGSIFGESKAVYFYLFI